MSSAHKVTVEDVNDAIVSATFTVLPDGRTTVCQLTLDNDFTVIGKSACVSAANFDEELGKKYSCEDAMDQVWKFLAFRLADKLAAEKVANDLVSELSDGDCDGCKI